MKNPVKKFMDKLHKPSTHNDRTKYDRVKESRGHCKIRKSNHWDWEWMCSDEERKPFDKSKMKYSDGDNT